MELPHTFRPLAARVAAILIGAVLIGALASTWLALPSDSRELFSTGQRITLMLVFGGVLAILYALGGTRAIAQDDRLIVINGYRRHEYEWPQIVAVRLDSGDPWVMLDTSDGETRALMAIQATDGARAQRDLEVLNRIVASRSKTDRDS